MQALLSLFLQHQNVSTDTRNIIPGSIFFCLKGPNFDGNTFAEEALKKGAAHVISDDSRYKGKKNITVVENGLITLQKLANAYRHHLNCKVFALTGSNGKTTTKELIVTVLNQEKKVWGTPGNFNNHIGVPLTILQAPNKTEILVIEMGDNKPGDIKELCEIAAPDFGYITNVGKDHLAGYNDSMELNIATKNELNQYLSDTGGIAFYSSEDELTTHLAQKVENHIGVEAYLENWKLKKLPSSPTVNFRVGEATINSHLIGDYNFQNIKIALGLGAFFSIGKEKMLRAISSYSPSNNRSQWVKTASNQLVLDAYNSNPSSLEKALKSFVSLSTHSKKGVILGDMLELGSIERDEHKKVLRYLADQQFAHVLLVGGLFYSFKSAFPNFLFFQNTGEAAEYLSQNPIKKAFLLLKGSRGIRLEKLTEVL